MSGGVEYADGARNNPFPRSWGTPPADPSSEERRRWVLAHTWRDIVNRKMTPDDYRRVLQRKRLAP